MNLDEAKLKIDSLKASGLPNPSLILAIESMGLNGEKEAALLYAATKYSPDINFQLTDSGNAERLINRHGANLRFCYERRKWLFWNGKYWEWVDDGKVIQLATETIKNIHCELAQKHGEEYRELLSHVKQSLGEQRLKSMIALAQAIQGVAVKASVLDSDIWLLNCNNGTLDLKTGDLLEHSRESYCTKSVPLDYDPRAPRGMWLTFLNRVMGGNQSLIAYLKRAIGYSLTGSVKEQVIFFLYGSGCNGKSTFVNTIRKLVVDYGMQARAETFLTNERNYHSTGESLANLEGMRFVAATELEEGKRLADAQIKAMTGGEPIRADRKYEAERQFEVSFKIFLSGNHKPKITDTTNGIWRRVKLIPFLVTIPENEIDQDLPDKLESELPGILAWAVEGCLEWQRKGLGEPEEVKKATQIYRDEEDSLGEFIRDRCQIEANATVEKGKLFDSYFTWCNLSREEQLSKREFTSRLIEKGISSKRGTGGIRLWRGIRLLDLTEQLNNGE